MKKSTLLTCLAALSLLMAACTPKEQPKPDDTSKEPVTSADPSQQPPSGPVIKAEAVTIDGLAGTYGIPYTIENPVNGKKLSAETTGDWLFGLTVKDAEVSFDVEHNFRADHEATVTLSYEGAESVDVTVTQPRITFEDFDLSVKEVGYNTATAVITPKKHKGNYFFEILSVTGTQKKIGLDTHQPGEMEYAEGLYQDDLAWLKSVAEQNNLSLHMALHHLGNMYKMTETGEPIEMPYSTLNPGVDYFLIVYGMDHEGVRTTPISFLEFTTDEIQMSDQQLSGSVSKITQNGAMLNITSTDENGTFYWTYIDDSDYQTYDTKTIADNMMKNLQYDWSQNYSQYTYAAYLEAVLDKGSAAYELSELLMGTTYHILAWGADLDGQITTQVFHIAEFTTQVPEVEDHCQFDVTVLKTESMDIKVRIVPTSNTTRYYVAFIDDERYSKFNDYQMINKILDMENNRLASGSYGADVTWANHPDLFTGTQELWGRRDLQWRFDPEKWYRLYIFGIDDKGVLSTVIFRKNLKTGAPEASSMVIKASLVQCDWHTVTFQMTPDNDNEYYMPFLTTKAIMDTYRYNDGSLMEEAIMAQIRDIYEDEANQYVYKGPAQFYTTWLPETEYSLIIFGYAGTNTTPMYEYTFTSPRIPFDEANCDLSYTYELFMAGDLKKLNASMWERYDDDECVMKVNISTTGEPAHWYWGLWPPKENFETSGGIAHLMSLLVQPELTGNNLIDKKIGFLRPWWYGESKTEFVTEKGEHLNYRPWSITAYADDGTGKFGPLHYEIFIPVPKPKAEVTGPYEVGITEAYDFWSDPAGAPYTLVSAPKIQ